MSRPGPTSRALLLAGAAAACLAVYASTARAFADHDVFVMARVADAVLHGKTLYGEAWENRAPLGILFYAVPGALAPRSYLAIQLWLAAWLLAQAGLLLRLAPVRWGPARPLAAAALLLLPLTRRAYVWASSEHASNLFVLVVLLVAARAAARRRLALGELAAAGAALACAVHVRQTSAVYLLPLAVGAWRAGGPLAARARAAAAIAAGGVAATAAVAAVATALGSFRGYLHVVFLAPGRYAAGAEATAQLLGSSWNDTAVLALLAATALAGLGPLRGVALSALFATLVAVLAPRRPFLHYWGHAIPVTAVALALGLDALAAARRRAAAVAGAVAVAVLLVAAAGGLVHLRRGRPSVRDHDALAAEIVARARPGDTLFALGEGDAYLYFATGLDPANVFFWPPWLREDLHVLPVPLGEVLAEYRARPPALLVVEEPRLRRLLAGADPAEAGLARLVADLLAGGRYRPVGGRDGWTILRDASRG